MAHHGHGLYWGMLVTSLVSELLPRPIRLDLEWLVAVWVSVEQDKSPSLGVDQGGARPQTSSDTEPALRGRARRSQLSQVGRYGARTQRPGEAEPALRGQARRNPPSEAGQGGACP